MSPALIIHHFVQSEACAKACDDWHIAAEIRSEKSQAL